MYGGGPAGYGIHSGFVTSHSGTGPEAPLTSPIAGPRYLHSVVSLRNSSACWHRVLSYLCPPVYTSHHNFKKTVGSSREHAPWAVTVRIQKKNSGVNGSHLGGSVSCLQFLCFQRNRPESICQTAMRIRRRKASRITESKATHQ